MSWESLQISSLETESASGRFTPGRMASYLASLLDDGNLSRMTYSNCSLVGDYKRRPTMDPEDRETPSTCKVHYPSLPGLLSREGFRGTSAMKSVMT